MVKIVSPRPVPELKALPQVLYIGPHESELFAAVRLVFGLKVVATRSAEQGLGHARQRRFDLVIFDQRDPGLASKHVSGLVQGFGRDVKLVVVSGLGNLGAYLKVPGLAAVLSAPIRPHQLLRVLGIEPPAEMTPASTGVTRPAIGVSPMAPRREQRAAS